MHPKSTLLTMLSHGLAVVEMNEVVELFILHAMPSISKILMNNNFKNQNTTYK